MGRRGVRRLTAHRCVWDVLEHHGFLPPLPSPASGGLLFTLCSPVPSALTSFSRAAPAALRGGRVFNQCLIQQQQITKQPPRAFGRDSRDLQFQALCMNKNCQCQRFSCQRGPGGAGCCDLPGGALGKRLSLCHPPAAPAAGVCGCVCPEHGRVSVSPSSPLPCSVTGDTLSHESRYIPPMICHRVSGCAFLIVFLARLEKGWTPLRCGAGSCCQTPLLPSGRAARNRLLPSPSSVGVFRALLILLLLPWPDS